MQRFITLIAVLLLGGCGTPPAVGPLLQSVQRVVRQEVILQDEDLQRDLQQLAHLRETLAAGFEKDLAETTTLTADWVREAVDIYTVAREELVRQELHLRDTRLRRIDNLHAADEAIERALWLMHQQDVLFDRALGGRAWRLVQDQPLVKEMK